MSLPQINKLNVVLPDDKGNGTHGTQPVDYLEFYSLLWKEHKNK